MKDSINVVASRALIAERLQYRDLCHFFDDNSVIACYNILGNIVIFTGLVYCVLCFIAAQGF